MHQYFIAGRPIRLYGIGKQSDGFAIIGNSSLCSPIHVLCSPIMSSETVYIIKKWGQHDREWSIRL